MPEQAHTCALGCSFEQDCTEECLRTETGLSENCTDCFGGLLACVVQYCSSPCFGGLDEVCQSCLAGSGCLSDFTECAGYNPFPDAELPADPAPDMGTDQTETGDTTNDMPPDLVGPDARVRIRNQDYTDAGFGACMRIEGSNNNRLQNLRIANCVGYGLTIERSSDHVVRDIRVTGAVEFAVIIHDNSQRIHVSSGRFVSNPNLRGLTISDSSHCTVRDVIIANNGGTSGITEDGLNLYRSFNNVILDVLVANNKDNGIEFAESANNIVINATSVNNGNLGFRIVGNPGDDYSEYGHNLLQNLATFNQSQGLTLGTEAQSK